MRKWIMLVVAVMSASCFAESIPEPVKEGPKQPPLPTELVASAPEALTPDEVLYIKRNFRTAVVNDCLNIIIVMENDKNSGALTRITHPMANPVSALIVTKVWKDGDDFEKDLFSTVYKDADARNKVRVWDIQGEITFIRSKIDAKIKDDPKLCDDLLAAVKAIEKEREKKGK